MKKAEESNLTFLEIRWQAHKHRQMQQPSFHNGVPCSAHARLGKRSQLPKTCSNPADESWRKFWQFLAPSSIESRVSNGPVIIKLCLVEFVQFAVGR